MTEAPDFWCENFQLWWLRARTDAARAHRHVRRLLGWRVHQGDGAAMANELGYLWVVAKPQREHVVFAVDHDGLPPAQGQGLLGDHQMAGRDLFPGPGQAAGD